MAFVSVGAVLASLVVNLGPIISQVSRESLEQLEAEERKLERDVTGKKKKDG